MYFLVNAPVCDLRRSPVPHERRYVKDLMQESQLLFGEPVLLKEVQGEWAFVEALNQKKCTKGIWSGYYGWVLFSQLIPAKTIPKYNLIVKKTWAKVGKLSLSFGTRLKGAKQDKSWLIELPDGSKASVDETEVSLISFSNELSEEVRSAIMNLGGQLIGAPYLWGGRSAYDPYNELQITSLDCSALSNLLYSFAGIDLPRDAHDQFLGCKEIEFKSLKTADFIFLADNANLDRMSHVMLYLKDDTMLESTIDPGCVRFVEGKEKLGCSLSSLRSGEITNKYLVKFCKLDL
jgi:gamma-D-glutamyl-L-lysine dipeptidyl-peptidase